MRGVEGHQQRAMLRCGERKKLRRTLFSGLILWLDDVAETVDTRKETDVFLVWVTVADPLGTLASCPH